MNDWDRCTPYLEAACEHAGGLYDLTYVAHAIADGEAHFWPGERSAVVTTFWHYPGRKVLSYWLAGGDIDELLQDMQPVIEQWAREQGCTDIALAGRRGWARVMPDFREAWTVLHKELTP